MTKNDAMTAALGHTQQVYRALSELSDLTQEMEAAVAGEDTVTLQLYLKLRADVLDRAWEHKRQLRGLCSSLPSEDGERLLAILSAEVEETTPEEQPLLEQVQRNQALLTRILAVDQRVSLRVGGEKSFYQRKAQ